MTDPATIREHMPVIGSDGEHVGTVDHVDGDRIKLTKNDSRDGSHHYIPLSSVLRVDEHVHLSIPAISAIPGGAGPALGAAAAPRPHGDAPVVGGPRRNVWPWIAAAIGLLLLLLLFKSCVSDREQRTAPNTTTTISDTASTSTTTMAGVSGLGGYLGGGEALPRTFTFEQLNFDSGKSDIRPADQAEVDAVAAALTQHGNARVRVAGFADALGADPANRQLGQARADAVKAALVAKGIDAGRIETASGGETGPVDTNATAGGRAENRRTELVVTAR